MRHILLPRAMAGSSCCMIQPPATAQLIAPASCPLGLHARLLCTAAGAITLAAVAAAADINLSPAARAQEKPQPRNFCFPFGRFRMWTRTATSGILPRHACSAPCRGTAPMRDLAVAGRCRACLNQPNRSSSPQCVLVTQKSRAQRTKACGYVDNARALPTSPQAQQKWQQDSIW